MAVELDPSELTEQLRRELRERVDIFLHDGAELARKYGGPDAGKDVRAVSIIAEVLAGQYAAEVVSAGLRDLRSEVAEATRTLRLNASRKS